MRSHASTSNVDLNIQVIKTIQGMIAKKAPEIQVLNAVMSSAGNVWHAGVVLITEYAEAS